VQQQHGILVAEGVDVAMVLHVEHCHVPAVERAQQRVFVRTQHDLIDQPVPLFLRQVKGTSPTSSLVGRV